MRIPRAEFLRDANDLIRAGERLVEDPAWEPFRTWLLDSDRFLERAWGRMDRYHLAWLNVGRDSAPPGSPLDAAGERRFVAAVAGAKLAVLRTMVASVEREAPRDRSRAEPGEQLGGSAPDDRTEDP